MAENYREKTLPSSVNEVHEDHMNVYLGITTTSTVLVCVANTCQMVLVSNAQYAYYPDLPVNRILMRTSRARGGATSTSSILKGSPAPQQTAALHVIVLPTVSSMVAGNDIAKHSAVRPHFL